MDVNIIWRNKEFFVGFAIAAFLSGVTAYFLRNFARTIVINVIETDPGIPLTRKNVTCLIISESLVRASQEATQDQGSVLLRPASAEHESQEL